MTRRFDPFVLWPKRKWAVALGLTAMVGVGLGIYWQKANTQCVEMANVGGSQNACTCTLRLHQ